MADNGRSGYRPAKRPSERTDEAVNRRRGQTEKSGEIAARSRSQTAEKGRSSVSGGRNTNADSGIPKAGGRIPNSDGMNTGSVRPRSASGRTPVRDPASLSRPTGSSQSSGRAPRTNQRTTAVAQNTPLGPQKRGGPLSIFRRKSEEMIRLEEEQWNEGVIRTRGGIDRVFLALVIALLCMGTIMVFSASYPYALSKTGDGLFYIKKQVVFALLGVVAMVGVSFIPYRFYRDFSWAIYGVACVLLVLVLVMGLSEGGAQRWLGIPGTSIQLQPSELMKAALPIVLAWYYDKYRKKVLNRDSLAHSFLYSIGIPMIFLGVACGLVLAEKHLSGTLILAAIGFVVMYLGGAHLGILAGSGGVFLAVALLYIKFNSYAAQRVETLVGGSADNLGDRWQVNQGLYAIGNGGVMGVGLGESMQKNSYVSQAQNDFIFTIWCEEMGFVGAVVVILVFCALIWRGYSIAKKAPDTFSSLVVFGIVSQVGIQAFLNMCVVTELIPNTGISLPFFSYGGTSLVVLMAEMGIILSVSRQSYLKK